MTLELVVAIAILAAALIPISFGILLESRMLRESYFDAVAMEVVDGEMELLMAGGWKQIPPGEQPWSTKAEAAKNLPPGRFLLTRTDKRVRLEWLPDPGGKMKAHQREFALP